MPEDILVVEYEPRYTERVRQALSGHAFQPVFARDGEEALRALENTQPKLIVVSSMLPKMTSADLIHRIRVQGGEQAPPILLTITGYNGKSPKADAGKVGASDLLPKPYSSSEFLGKVNQMLGLEAPHAQAVWSPAEISDELSRPAPAAPAPVAPAPVSPEPARAKKVNAMGDIDQMLAQTLAGVRLPSAKKGTDPGAKAAAKPKSSALPDLDKLLDDTRSGLEKKLKSKETLPAPPAPAVSTETRPHMPGKWMNPVVPPVEPAAEAAPVEEETPDGIRFGQYVLTEKIATGGMAEVWKAKMRGVEGFQKIVAIKKILPHLSDNSEFVDMFIDEAKLAAQLNHSNVIHIYDLGKIANSYYIAMEYIEGHDLKSILRRATERSQPLPIELALFVVSKIASALDYAHRRRDFDDHELELVHRDVSPQNVLISYEGDIKLCDFGIAKAASKASHTLAGALKGKLQYMSPEQAWGRKIDRRSDIFALGVVLFELLTGRKLFIGENELSILEVVRQAKVVAPSTLNDEVTPEIDAIVLRALQRDPENRYQTAGEMAKDLDAIVYNFWPTPTSADLAIFMHHLYSRDVPANEPPAAHPDIPAPAVIMPPFDAQQQPATAEAEEQSDEVSFPILVPPPAPEPAVEVPVVAAPSTMFAESAPERRRVPAMAIGLGVLLLAGGASGGYMYWRSRASEPAASAGSGPAAAPGTRQAGVITPEQTAAASLSPALPQAAADQAALAVPAGAAGLTDEARINEEVRRRLEAERLRLQGQATAQQPGAQAQRQNPTTDTVSQVVVAPISSEATTATTQTFVEPPPTPVPTPEPVVVQATPIPAPAATPAVAAVQTPRPVREGDLVDASTEGLIPAQLIKQYKPPYPPAAKMQKVEGLVVVQALISETGKVLETRILRGVSQKVGINEAAIEAVRRSSFRPATKDGVRVKSYKNITIPFKL